MKNIFITTTFLLTINTFAQDVNKDTTHCEDYGMRIYNSTISRYVATNSTTHNLSSSKNKQVDLKDTNKIKDCDYKVYYYPNGNKKEEGCLVKGLKEGIWNEFYLNSEKKFEWTFKNDKKSGKYKAYYNNGKLNAFGNYSDGALSDSLYIYNEDGIILSKSFWKISGYKTSKIVWKKIYNKDAKNDGTIEVINGKRYYWQLGQKLELKN